MTALINEHRTKIYRATWFYKDDDGHTAYSAEIPKLLEDHYLSNNFSTPLVITKTPLREVISEKATNGVTVYKQIRKTKNAKLARDVYRGWNGQTCIVTDNYPTSPMFQVFGVDLATLMQHPTNLNRTTPLIFEQCITMLLREGPSSEGIFRLSGSQHKMEEIRRQWDTGHTVHMLPDEINDIAGILKLFIRELPDSLTCNSLYSKWLDCETDNPEQFISNIKAILKELPKTNVEMLKGLFKLLHVITQNQNINKMNPSNLAVCWGPNIFRAEGEALLLDTTRIGQVVIFMIGNTSQIFFDTCQ
eukprot:TRINITY_DN3318_c0_g1_i1.p1 TRINITY_DN3318_c0_g1~~TRINITY_DN3318_c0_g1_i1.p1  ORF type:complete len:343 (-),score=55.18 TRINITY_DN3318_c0_g1_i1:103-1014(-)